MKKISLFAVSIFAFLVIATPASATGSQKHYQSSKSYTKSLWSIPKTKKSFSVTKGKSYYSKTSSYSSVKVVKKKTWYKRVVIKILALCGKSVSGSHPGKTKSVPEIDAASTGIALALLGGIVAIRRERRKV